MDMLSGLYAASVTPLRKDFSCDIEALTLHCKDLLERGCQGVVLFGTTGEGPSFSLRERIDILRQIASSIDPQKIIVGASFSAIQDVVELSHVAESLNCLALLISPPFYYKGVTNEGIIAFYSELVRHIHLPIILYHIPQVTGVPIPIEVVTHLYRQYPDKVVGIKESEGNFAITQALCKLPGFKVFVGNESQIEEAIRIGASGAISGLANIYPNLMTMNREEIAKLKRTLSDYPIFPAIKALVAKEKGASFELMRPPLVALTKESMRLLHDG